MVYINGSDHNQLELDVDPNDIKIGFGDFFQTLLGKEYQRKAVGNKKFIIRFRFNMSLLQSAESHLGPLAPWPSNILNYLFFDHPTFRKELRLINFFYGNCVPCCLSVQLFHACNDDTDAFMTEDVYYFYNQYEKNTDFVHMGIYFHMHI